MKWKEIERICVQSCSKFFGYFRSLNIPPFFFFNEIFIITSIPSQCFPLRFLIFSKHDIALTKYFRKKIFERECRTVQRIENPREGRINTDKGTIYPSVEFRNFRDRSENWKRDWKETKKGGGKEYADREAKNVGDRNDRSDATGSTPPWITLSANWQQTNETVSKSRCARIPLPSPNSRSLCTRLNSLTIYILYIYILYSYIHSSMVIFYSHRYLPSGISHSLQLYQGEYISSCCSFLSISTNCKQRLRVVVRINEMDDASALFLFKITFLWFKRFEINFVNSFLLISDEISLLIFPSNILRYINNTSRYSSILFSS